MPEFFYKAMSDDGRVIDDVVEAPNIGTVAEKIDKLGYIPLEIKEQNAKDRKLFSKKEKVKHDEIVLFTKQLVTLLKAGVPFLTSLEALAEQTSNEKMKEVIREIYVSVESGKSFSEALKAYPDIFSNLYISSINAGEMSGQLDEVLERMAAVMEYDKQTRDKIKSAMRYPMIVVSAMVIAFVILILLVVPKFADMFQQLGADLPLPTKIIIGMNTLLQNFWPYILIGLAVSIVGFKKWRSTEKGSKKWDETILKFPLIGDLVLKNAMSRFAKMFETLNKSGLPILQTFEIVSETVGNTFIGMKVKEVGKGVEKGEGITRPLRKLNLFPPMVVRMISIGEQSGSLDEMLANISAHYDTEVDYEVKKLSGMIEPILTIGIGIMIAFLALSIFLPMWNIMGHIH